jgi:polyisoprenyl-teichoic acid--peptidoglycan teichoic acid transferase
VPFLQRFWSGLKNLVSAESPPRGWTLLGIAGLSLFSSSLGIAWALIGTTTPLQQRQLTAAEASVFGSGDRLIGGTNSFSPLSRPVNILVLGTKVLTSDLDQPPPTPQTYLQLVDSFEGLADTILLLHFNPTSQRLVILSIPRDTLTWIDGRGEAKINEANLIGGPALSAKTVSELLGGVPIDRYLRVNIQGIEKLVDALGGVTVYVPKDMKYKDESQHLYIDLKAGRQHLNGNQTLQLLRFRYDEWGDIGRIQRQQELMRNLIEQSLTPTNLSNIPQVLSVISSNVDTNLKIEELMGLVGFIAKTQRSQVQMLMLPGGFNGDGQDGPSYWLPNSDRIQMIMAQHFDQPQLESSTSDSNDPAWLRVAIQDSTQKPEAVDQLISTLKRSGYQEVYADEPWSEPLQVTRIIAQQGDYTAAAALRQKLGFGEVRIDSTGVLSSDVTIQLGQDGLALPPNPTPTDSAP